MRRRSNYDDIIELRGYRFGVRYSPDDDYREPWKEADGHGIVSDWTRRGKGPGERILCEDRQARRYYDVAGTLKIARRDGRGTAKGRLPGETLKAYRARAVDADFEYLRAWCADEWRYVSIMVDWLDPDVDDDVPDPSGLSESVGGVETWKDYHETCARELVDELLSRIEVPEPVTVRGEN
jgi:hypothetical protein